MLCEVFSESGPIHIHEYLCYHDLDRGRLSPSRTASIRLWVINPNLCTGARVTYLPQSGRISHSTGMTVQFFNFPLFLSSQRTTTFCCPLPPLFANSLMSQQIWKWASRSGGPKRPPRDQRDNSCLRSACTTRQEYRRDKERGLQRAMCILGLASLRPVSIPHALSVLYALSPSLAVFPQLSMKTNHPLVGTNMRHYFLYDDPTAIGQVCFSVISLLLTRQ